MQCDLEASASGQSLALVDAAARDGRALLLHIGDDCDARIRVFVDEEPPAELSAAARPLRLADASLSVPSGRLLATGAEAIGAHESQLEPGTHAAAQVPAGSYRVSAFQTFEWKARHRAAYIARTSSRAARLLLGAETAFGIGAAMFLVGNFFLLPGLGMLALKRGGGWPLRALAVLLAVDALFFVALLAFQRWMVPSALYRRAHAAQDQFERAFPDVVVQLTSSR
jgi:hypothetical protein